MSKEATISKMETPTLTEQWRNGMLEDGFYYVKFPEEGVEIVNTYMLKQLALVRDADKIEVLAPVPSYEEWVKNGTWYTEKSHNELLKKIEKLEQQLKEAEQVLMYVAEIYEPIHVYCKKYGVEK